MVENILQFALALPIAIIIIFIVSLPFYFLLLGFDEEVHNNGWGEVITLVIAIIIIILVVCFGL